jgi:hypothetical protein
VAIAWATEYWALRGLTQEALAEVLQRTGRTDEAAEALGRAIAAYEEKGNVVSAASAGKTLAELAVESRVPPA